MSGVLSPKRLNFGCGYDKRDGYVNVDSDPACAPDVLLVNNDLSVLPSNTFEEILALDVLEHIPRTQTLPVLVDWAELLVEGGRIRVETSSISGVAAKLASDPSFASQFGWTQCLFGTQAHPGDFHCTGFTDTTLSVHLLAAGFEISRLWVDDDWLLNVEAVKSHTWSTVVGRSSSMSDTRFIETIYQEVLGRTPDHDGERYLQTELGAHRMSRRQATRHLMTSAERLYVTAAKHNL
jgi:predicted SAM-dependent methyltransferase